jgi:hypothetical protein
LLKQTADFACAFVFDKAGTSVDTSNVMIAITTNNSIKVKAFCLTIHLTAPTLTFSASLPFNIFPPRAQETSRNAPAGHLPGAERTPVRPGRRPGSVRPVGRRPLYVTSAATLFSLHHLQDSRPHPAPLLFCERSEALRTGRKASLI